MREEVENYKQRVLKPSNGMWLYNKETKTITDSVYLAKTSKESDWTEITAEEKARLEKQWEKEVEKAEETVDEKINELQQQNQMLTDCILEMSELLYV